MPSKHWWRRAQAVVAAVAVLPDACLPLSWGCTT